MSGASQPETDSVSAIVTVDHCRRVVQGEVEEGRRSHPDPQPDHTDERAKAKENMLTTIPRLLARPNFCRRVEVRVLKKVARAQAEVSDLPRGPRAPNHITANRMLDQEPQNLVAHPKLHHMPGPMCLIPMPGLMLQSPMPGLMLRSPMRDQRPADLMLSQTTTQDHMLRTQMLNQKTQGHMPHGHTRVRKVQNRMPHGRTQGRKTQDRMPRGRMPSRKMQDHMLGLQHFRSRPLNPQHLALASANANPNTPPLYVASHSGRRCCTK